MEIDKTRTVGFIYFAECASFVKIGYSYQSPRKRVYGLSLKIPLEVTLMGLMFGGRDKETELHRAYAHLRHRNEWFRLTPELRADINEMCGDWSGLDSMFGVR